MPVFNYTSRTRRGERRDGSVEAGDRRDALRQIAERGLVPISVTEGSETKVGRKRGKLEWRSGQAKMSPREVLMFTTELSDLLASGMTLGSALNSLARRKSGRPRDDVIAGVRDEIVRGSSLSDAMAQYPASFQSLYVNMIRAGEASGALPEVLRCLVTHFERIQETKEKIVMALVYPGIVLTLGVCTLIFSMVFVVPKFKVIFEQMEQALPLPTRILIGASTWLARYGVFALIGMLILAVLAKRAVNTRQGRLWWHGLLLRMPLIRGVVASGIYANFARTLGTLLTNGVPVLKALSIVESTVGNAVIAAELNKARDRVTDGTTISGPLAAGKVLPVMMTDMLSIGEETGDMSGALNHIARRYDNELSRNIKVFTTALEPIMIVVVAILVGFVAVSILMAVFNLTSGLN